MSTARTIRRARAIYATAPAHTPAKTATVPDGTHCILTALLQAAGVITVNGPDENEAAYDDALDALKRLVTVTLPEYNATHTTDEVLALLDRAVEIAEAREQEFRVPVSTPTELVAA